MPDVPIDVAGFLPNSRLQTACTVESSPGTFYQFLLTNARTLVYRKSTAGVGGPWGSPVTVRTDALEELIKAVIWPDRWTDGISGNLVHIFYICRDPGAGATSTREYRNLDVSDDSMSTPVSVGAGGVHPTANWAASCISLVKTRAGNLYIGGIIDAGAGDHWLLRSDDDGLTWTAAGVLASFAEAPAIDDFMFLPANAADADDFWCIFLDRTARELTPKTFDASDGASGSWSEGAAFVNAVTQADGTYFQFAASVRWSDGSAIIAIWNEINNAFADWRFYEWDGTTATVLTPLSINVDNAGVTTCLIDQSTDDIYVARLWGSAWEVTVGVQAWRSQDGGTTWAALGDYSADADDDLRWLSCDISPPAGGTFMVVWFNQDLFDTLTNADNAIALPAPPTPGGSAGQQQRTLLL